MFWPSFAALVGAGLAIYGYLKLRRELGSPIEATNFWFEGTCWLLLCIYAAVQIIPIGHLSFRVESGAQLAISQVSLAPGMTSLVLPQLVSYAGIAFLAAQAAARARRARRLQIGIVTVVAAFAAYGLIALTQLHDTILGLAKWAYQGSATSTFVNRNTFATFLALGLVNAVALTFSELALAKSRGVRHFAAFLWVAPSVVAVSLIFVTLVASNSRMGLFAGVCGTVVTMVLAGVQHGRSRLRIVLLSGMIGLGVGASAWLYGQGLLDRLASVESDLDVRTDLYGQVWQLISLRPWLGFGGGAFQYAFPLVHRPPVSLDLVWDKAHSTYLALWAEFGLVAGSLPLLAIASVFGRLLLRSFGRATFSSNGAAAIGGVVVCAVHSVVDFSLEIQAVAYLFAVILGAGMGSPAELTEQ
jgi:O-antigen ligase